MDVVWTPKQSCMCTGVKVQCVSFVVISCYRFAEDNNFVCFVYHHCSAEGGDEVLEEVEQFDEDGKRMITYEVCLFNGPKLHAGYSRKKTV